MSEFGIVCRSAKTSFKQIKELDLRVGDEIIVELAGKVIPHIVRNLSAERRHAAELRDRQQLQPQHVD